MLEASKRISCALACADRHIGLCTSSISLCTDPVQDSLINPPGRSQASLSPSILPNVVSLELLLGYEDGSDIERARQLASSLLQRLPNLVAARIDYPIKRGVFPVPLLKLKHLCLWVPTPDSLEGMSFSAHLPKLETASISVDNTWSPVSRIDFSGCQHLVRLVMSNIPVRCLSKPSQCSLRVFLCCGDYDVYRDTSMAQQGMPNVREIYLDGDELCSPEGLLARCCLPELEVIRCSGPHTLFNGQSDKLDPFMHCLRHSRNVPALKSILCGDHRIPANRSAVKICIPAFLAGVQNMMLATDRSVELVFGSARSAGESLTALCVVASEIRVDAAALLGMTDALLRRGLTLSMAHAGQEHEHAPSQCMYVRAVSAPELSYDEAVQCVNKRIGSWARDYGCGQCVACHYCLRGAGLLAWRSAFQNIGSPYT